MASLAFQKFKAMENNSTKSEAGNESNPNGRGRLSSVSSSSSKYSLQTQETPPPKKQKRRNFIGDLANRFESDEKKKKEEEQRKEFMRLEIERQEKAETERRKLEQERLEKERAKLEEERIEMERNQKEEEANRRKEERRRKLEKDDEQYANLKPAQALFARRAATRSSQNSSNKENKSFDAPDSNNRRINDMKAKYFQQVENKEVNGPNNINNGISKVKSSDSFKDTQQNEKPDMDALPRKQSGTDMFCDLYTKGNCSNIKNIFEQNIAVKKGFMPDPNLTNKDTLSQQPDLLKVAPNKVKTNASQIAKQFDQNKLDRNDSLRSKEYIPINKKTFTHFLDKFEDDRSRQAAKAQLQQLTLEQKQYLSQDAPSWLKKQEAKERKEIEKHQKILRQEEERIILEEEKERLQYERKKRLEQEAEEKMKQKEIEELQGRIEKEKKELLVAKKAATKAKKEAKRKSKLGSSPPTELPKIVSSTCNDLKKKFDVKKGVKTEQISDKEEVRKQGGPVVRKLSANPFEQSLEKNENSNVVKRREFPVLKQNRIGDIKKRYTMFMTGESATDKESSETNNDVPLGTSYENRENSEHTPEHLKCQLMEVEKPHKNILSPESFFKTKAFIRLSAEKLTNSKEKLFKTSKEKVHEVNSCEDARTLTRKPSKNDMQNYLISKVLFDDNKPVSALKQNDIPESLGEHNSDQEEVVLDDEYVKEMEKYLMFIDEDYSTSKKKKKKKGKKKQEPKIQIVQVNHIKQQFETKNFLNGKLENKVLSPMGTNKESDFNIITNEHGIGKLKQRFQFATTNETKNMEKIEGKPQPKKVSRMINQDLLKKFDSPVSLEELKLIREKDREERKIQRIAKLEEEKIIEEERKKETLRLEEERLRLEQERLEALRIEQLRIVEEQRKDKKRKEEETRMAAAYEEALQIEKEKASKRQVKELAIKSLREKNEPALKKKKVLGRIQHMFEKNVPESKDDENKIGRVGSLKGKADQLFSNDGNNNSTKKSFQDPSLSGVGIVRDKFKEKFEVTPDEPMTLFKGGPIKKKDIPSALVFEQKLKEQSQAQNNSPVRQASTDWSWKKTDPKELAVQNTIAIHGESKPQKSKTAEREQRRNDQHRELLADIHDMNKRLMKKNAIKEHEEKMNEYGEFMSEIQNYLNEPDKSASESTFKDDIQNYINVVGSSIVSNKTRHKSNEKKMSAAQKVKEQNNSNTNHPKLKIGIADIKNKLSESGNTFVQKEREPEILGSNQLKNNVKSMKQKLVDQYFSQMNTPQQPDISLQKCESGPVAVSESISKTKDLFETKAREDQLNISEPNSSSTFKKKSVNVPSIFTQNLQDESPTEEDPSIRKSSFEWKYKKKSILDFQQFLDENKGLVPNEISQGCANIATNLTEGHDLNMKTENDVIDKSEERSIEEYNTLMKAVDCYLAAPDKSTNEIDFKSEVERYLDLIEVPERVSNQTIPTNNDSNVVRRPKKLDLSQYANGSRPKSQYENLLAQVEETDIAPVTKKPNSKSIKNLQNKLLLETGKLMEKEDLQLHIAGADQIKKAYEKLNKSEDKALLSAPKSTLQKTFAQMKDEIAPETTLENLKAKHTKKEWTWKQKSMSALNTSIKMFKNHGINTPAKIEEQHKKIVQTNEYLRSKEVAAKSSNDVEEIKKLQDLRDEEIEIFLREMKVYIEKPSSTNKESSLKSGITDYLDLIDDETHVVTRDEGKANIDEDKSKTNHGVPKIGQVSNIKQLLERDSGGGLGSSEKNQDKWKRGKVDASFFINEQDENSANDTNSKFVDPVMSSVNSNKIKQQLESQCAMDDEEKTLTSAPKRKFKTFDPQQVTEASTSTSTKSYLEVRAVECDYKKYKKLYLEDKPKPKEDKPKVPSSYSHITDENERKAAILAKYGCKPRPQRLDSESSTSSTSSDDYDAEGDDEDGKVDENNIPLHIVQSNAMYAIYGDRLADKAPKKKEKPKKEESSDAMLQMLRAMRQESQTEKVRNNPHSGGPRKPRQDSVDSSDIDLSEIIPGSCADMKSKFEGRPTNAMGQKAPPPPQRTFSHANKRYYYFFSTLYSISI